MSSNPYESPQSGNDSAPSESPFARPAPLRTRLPTTIQFVCENCQKVSKPRQLPKHRGHCRKCGTGTWTLIASYVDHETEFSALGFLAGLTTGVGWAAVKKSENQTIANGVSADDAFRLTELKSQTSLRVSQYLQARDHAALREKGAQLCQSCGMLFVPAAQKPWTQSGYCSKACAVQDESPTMAATEAMFVPVAGQPDVALGGSNPMIAVVCPAGHAFRVLATFAGCLRACPDCGAKCRVP